ncbi:MAG: hypothetical protein ACI9HE_002464 [Planctomycetota bacterium]|jgi:hypothetical protein
MGALGVQTGARAWYTPPRSIRTAQRGSIQPMACSITWRELLLGFALLGPGQASPQIEPEPPTAVQAQDATPAMDDETRATLGALLKTSLAKELEINALWTELESDTDPVRREQLLAKIKGLSAALAQLLFDFESIATGIDVEVFLAPPADKSDLMTELENLIRPLLDELSAATEGPRTLEALRSSKADLIEREDTASKAVAGIDAQILALGTTEDSDLLTGLKQSRERWQKRLAEVESQLTVVEFKLNRREADRTPIVESVQEVVRSFVRTRGLNLASAIAAFCIVFFGLRGLYRLVEGIFPERGSKRAMHRRLIEVVVHVMAGIAALASCLLVLSAAGDWVLLGLVILSMLGIAWAGKLAIPRYLAEIRLLLNLGPVRESEQVTYHGLPYEIARLGMSTHLHNPALQNGQIRLPVRDLIDMRSRPVTEGELWFPCRLNDYVQLSDGCWGKVTRLTQEMVRIITKGGSEVTYSTADFLALAPKNISKGFRVSVTFGIDYAHQAIATTEVPEKMRLALTLGLAAVVDADAIESVKVEFESAAASSLDYAVLANFDGSVANNLERLTRAVQAILVDVCNTENWGIPFAQMVLHRPD